MFGKDNTDLLLKEPLIIVNFMKSEPLDPEVQDPKLFEEIKNFEVLKNKLDDLLE